MRDAKDFHEYQHVLGLDAGERSINGNILMYIRGSADEGDGLNGLSVCLSQLVRSLTRSLEPSSVTMPALLAYAKATPHLWAACARAVRSYSLLLVSGLLHVTLNYYLQVFIKIVRVLNLVCTGHGVVK